MAAAMEASANALSPRSNIWLMPHTKPVQKTAGTIATMAIPARMPVDAKDGRLPSYVAEAAVAERVFAYWSGIIFIQPFPLDEPTQQKEFR